MKSSTIIPIFLVAAFFFVAHGQESVLLQEKSLLTAEVEAHNEDMMPVNANWDDVAFPQVEEPPKEKKEKKDDVLSSQHSGKLLKRKGHISIETTIHHHSKSHDSNRVCKECGSGSDVISNADNKPVCNRCWGSEVKNRWKTLPASARGRGNCWDDAKTQDPEEACASLQDWLKGKRKGGATEKHRVTRITIRHTHSGEEEPVKDQKAAEADAIRQIVQEELKKHEDSPCKKEHHHHSEHNMRTIIRHEIHSGGHGQHKCGCKEKEEGPSIHEVVRKIVADEAKKCPPKEKKKHEGHHHHHHIRHEHHVSVKINRKKKAEKKAHDALDFFD